MSIRVPLPAVVAAILLGSCSDDVVPDRTSTASGGDPLLARALNDPLMVDPDLAYRNEANAAIMIRHDHALPPLRANEGADGRAREAARLALLEGGAIVDLPDPMSGEGPRALGGLGTANAILGALGADRACSTGLGEGFAWAARLPELASIMPHGMVSHAAGSDANGCSVRVIRYVTAAAPNDVLEYHYNRANRGGLRVARFGTPPDSVRGSRGGTQLIVQARPGPNGMSAVDLIYWQLRATP